MQRRELDLEHLHVGRGVAIPLELKRLDGSAGALGGVEHERIERLHDGLHLVDNPTHLSTERLVRGRAPTQAEGKQDVLQLLHEDGQDTVGKTDRERQALGAPEPQQAVRELVGIEPRKHRDACERDRGDFERQHEQRDERRQIAAEEQRHDEHIARLREDAEREDEQHERRHARQTRRGGGEQEHPQQDADIAYEPRRQAEEEVPQQKDARIELGDGRVIVAVGVFEHLVAQKVDGNLIHDVFRELFDHASSPSRLPACRSRHAGKQARKSFRV